MNNEYKIILIYPIPQMDLHVSSEIKKNLKNNFEPVQIVSINTSKYTNESKRIFTLFDSLKHKNLYKIYPHKKFCNNILKDNLHGTIQIYKCLLKLFFFGTYD